MTLHAGLPVCIHRYRWSNHSQRDQIICDTKKWSRAYTYLQRTGHISGPESESCMSTDPCSYRTQAQCCPLGGSHMTYSRQTSVHRNYKSKQLSRGLTFFIDVNSQFFNPKRCVKTEKVELFQRDLAFLRYVIC